MAEADGKDKATHAPAVPEPVDQREDTGWGNQGNIREKQQTHPGGAVPPAYTGSGDPDAETRPEDAADDSGRWDEQGRGSGG